MPADMAAWINVLDQAEYETACLIVRIQQEELSALTPNCHMQKAHNDDSAVARSAYAEELAK
jgi:hypothetical protein